MWVGVTIYEKEQILRDRVDQVLKTIRKDGYNPTLGVHYNELMAELHAVQKEITSLEEAVDAHLPR